MIKVMLRLHWLCLKRDRLALVLTFILPIAFFSIMTLVLQEMSNVTTLRKIEIGIVDRDDSYTTRYIIGQLQARREFVVRKLPAAVSGSIDQARLLRDTGLTAVAVFPENFEESLLGQSHERASVELIEDRANPIYAGILAELLEMALNGLAQLAVLSASQSGFDSVTGSAESGGNFPGAPSMVLDVERVDIFGERAGHPRDVTVAYWAAGTGVLFLLFAMAGAGASVIEEEETGILERMLTTGIPMTRLLAYKWLFFAALGSVQVSAMFLWGWLIYGVELFAGTHLWGFLIMTVTTALAAAGLGILLATVCRTRTQLAGVSTVLILVMSALGGSMFPRFLMSPALKTAGLATFNAWALDGYQKVFWYEAGLLDLWPQIAVLLLLAVLFMTAAFAIATRRAGS